MLTTEQKEERKRLREVNNALDPSVLYEKMVEGNHGDYIVRLHKDGSTSCTCFAWRFQKIPAPARSCKHTLEVFENYPPIDSTKFTKRSNNFFM